MSHSGNSTTEPSPTVDSFEADDAKYLIIPLVVIFLVMLLSILVYLMVKRSRMIKLRHAILKLYDFDSNEQEWESLPINEYPYYGNEYVTTNL